MRLKRAFFCSLLLTWNGTRWDESLSNEPVRQVTTVTYSTPGTYTYVVPAGMNYLLIDASGAVGSTGNGPGGAA